MFPTIAPLRAIAFQALFLLIAIAIETACLHRFLKTEPKQSVQYAASINLFCTVVGWLSLFLFFGLVSALPSTWSVNFKANLIGFIFFDQWTTETATTLILICFVMFFASFGLKQAGLTALKWLLQAGIKKDEPKKDAKPDTAATKTETAATGTPSSRQPAIRVLRGNVRDSQAQLRDGDTPTQSRAVLYANAWSFSAILAILLLRLVAQSTLNLDTPNDPFA